MSDTKFAFLDISIDSEAVGRIVVELFTKKAPKTCLNFLSLCGNHSDQEIPGLYLKNSYTGTKFHRVIKNFMVEAGDVVSAEGSGTEGGRGCSIYSPDGVDPGYFEDENLSGSFASPFLLGMANENTKDTNSSRFFITTGSSAHLNGKHTLFGRVVHGKSVVRELEKVDVDKDYNTLQICKIEDSGVWSKGDPVPVYNACYEKVAGDIYEEFPDDNTKENAPDFDPEKSDRALLAAETIKNAGTQLFKRGDFVNARFKYVKALRYTNELMPDKDQDKVNAPKFMDLKKKLFLNLSLCCAKLGEHARAAQYASYLLELDPEYSVTSLERSKALYRQGNAYIALKKHEDAVKSLKKAKELNEDDPNINSALEQAQKLVQQEKQKERERYAKMFGA